MQERGAGEDPAPVRWWTDRSVWNLLALDGLGDAVGGPALRVLTD